MALQIVFNKVIYGEIRAYKEAYLQIIYVSGTKEGVEITLSFFDSVNKGFELEKRQYSFIPSVEPDAKEWLTQGYEYLKTLLEFEDAIDILEEGQTPLNE